MCICYFVYLTNRDLLTWSAEIRDMRCHCLCLCVLCVHNIPATWQCSDHTWKSVMHIGRCILYTGRMISCNNCDVISLVFCCACTITYLVVVQSFCTMWFTWSTTGVHLEWCTVGQVHARPFRYLTFLCIYIAFDWLRIYIPLDTK